MNAIKAPTHAARVDHQDQALPPGVVGYRLGGHGRPNVPYFGYER